MIMKPSMASPPSLLLLIFLLSTTTSSSVLLLPLTHTLSHLQSPHNLQKTTSTRSAATRLPKSPTSTLSIPLSPGSDYTLNLPIGSSSTPQSISLYMDTGSDVVWFPCSPFECILCDEDENQNKNQNKNKTHFNLSTSTTIHCSSPLCSSVHSNSPTSDLCAMSNCSLESIELSECPVSSSCPAFYYAYGDGSFVAKLYSDKLSIPSLNIMNFTFGCAHTALAEPIGVAGFGRGRLSLPAQLASVNPLIGNQFSYCLISHSFRSDKIRKPSPLILGRRVDPVNEQVSAVNDRVKGKRTKLVYTPMLQNPKHPYFYLVGLTGISIGKTHIPAPASMAGVNTNGDGGLVVDSGTTFTMLPTKFYNSIAENFDKSVQKAWKRMSQQEPTTGLSHCYYLNDDVSNVAKRKSVPSLTLHYSGNGSSVTLPVRNYFYEFKMEDGDEAKRVGCLMLMDGGDEGEMGGPSGVLGNYFQQGFEVVYDLERERIGFVKRRCDSLWEELA